MKEYLFNLATDKSGGPLASILQLFLFIFSLIYGLAVRILILFSGFFSYRAGCKVVGVGNITLGGTGKTSLVELIALFLNKHGHRVAIISRGYKKRTKSQDPRAMSYDNMGDEPYMLSRKLEGITVIVDADRKRGIEKAIKDYAVDTVILDDAFQQWGVKKDLEIVTIDAVNPFGNKNMIPRGILREPIQSLSRAGIFVLTKTNLSADTECLKAALGNINPAVLIFESQHRPLGFYDIKNPGDLFAAQSLSGKTVALFSGIGDPGSFEKLILGLGIKIGLSFRFSDHHHYTDEDLKKIVSGALNKNLDTVITTEKDAVRMSGLWPINHNLQLLVLRIELKIKDEQGFNNRLLKLYTL